MIPAIGRIVHYKLNSTDAESITFRRGSNPGNRVSAGMVFPAMIVSIHGAHVEAYCNLQVFLDGPDNYWATSVKVGDGEREFTWPVKPNAQA